MVAHFRAEETVVSAPPQRCYDLVLAVRRCGEWWDGVRCEALGPQGVLRVGSRVRCRAGARSWVYEVVRLDPYRRIELHYEEGDLLGPVHWEFHAHPGGTRVRHVSRGLRSASSAAVGAETGADVPRLLADSVRDAALPGMRRVLATPGAEAPGADLFEALHTQRAVRRFCPDPIPDAVLREILAAATRAPSARNTQPWFFLAVRDPALKAEIGRHYLSAWRQAQAFTVALDGDADIKHRADYAGMMRQVDALAVHLDRAPVLVLCCLDTSQLGPMADERGQIRAPQSAYASIFPAVQNLMLAARGLGVGSTLTTVFFGVEAELRRAVGAPPHMHIAALVPLGYPTRPFRVTTRKAVDAVAFLDRWGQTLPP